MTATDMEELLDGGLQWRSAGDPVVLTEWWSHEDTEHYKSAHPVAAALARVDHPAFYAERPPLPPCLPGSLAQGKVYCRHFFFALVPRLNECQL